MKWSIRKKEITKIIGEEEVGGSGQEIIPRVIVKKAQMTKNSEKGTQYIARRQLREMMGVKKIKEKIEETMKYVAVVVMMMRMAKSIEESKEMIKQGKVRINGEEVRENRKVKKYDEIEVREIEEESIIRQRYVEIYREPVYIRKIGMNKGIIIGEPKIEEIQLPKKISKTAIERYRGK